VATAGSTRPGFTKSIDANVYKEDGYVMLPKEGGGGVK